VTKSETPNICENPVSKSKIPIIYATIAIKSKTLFNMREIVATKIPNTRGALMTKFKAPNNCGIIVTKSKTFFDVLLTVHLSIFTSVINQLDAQNVSFYSKFISCLYMFRAHVLIIRRSKLHYTASGIITPIGGRLVQLSPRWPPIGVTIPEAV